MQVSPVLLAFYPSLVEQAYEAIVSEIADGTLPPETHLVQETLATRYGVSRQPIQQALLLLKSDGLIEDSGRRGLVVAPLDLRATRERYQVRAALDGLAARLAAERCAASQSVSQSVRIEGERILNEGKAAVDAGAIKRMIAHDIAFHGFIYTASGNPMIGPTAAVHWRFLRRVMGEVLRRSEPPSTIWMQHGEILASILAGRPAEAESRILDHIQVAAGRLTEDMEKQADNVSRTGSRLNTKRTRTRAPFG